MAHYYCQMVDYDTPEDWSVITAASPKSAAIEYAEHCDASSGGELFSRPTSIQTVIVQDKASGDRQKFEVEVEFVKDFHAKPLQSAAA